MNVLIVGTSSYFQKDFNDFFEAQDHVPYFADSYRSAIKILIDQNIDIIFLEFSHFEDAELVKYINKNYPKARVVLSTSRKITEFLNILQNSRFKVIQTPYRFSELKKIM